MYSPAVHIWRIAHYKLAKCMTNGKRPNDVHHSIFVNHFSVLCKTLVFRYRQ